VGVGEATVAERLEEAIDGGQRLGADEEIEVAAGPEGRVGVEHLGERGPFQGDHRNSLAPEVYEELAQLAAQDQLARDVGGELPIEPLLDRPGHDGRRLRLEHEGQGRRQALGLGQRDQAVPAQRGRRRGNLWTTHGAQAGEEPADLGGHDHQEPRPARGFRAI
jgi:hypothetical protein